MCVESMLFEAMPSLPRVGQVVLATAPLVPSSLWWAQLAWHFAVSRCSETRVAIV